MTHVAFTAARRLVSLVLAAVCTAGTLGAVDHLSQTDPAVPSMVQRAVAGARG